MVRIGIVASRFAEAGTIDERRLVRQVGRLESRGLNVSCLFDPTQWELERSIIEGGCDLYLPLTMHAFERRVEAVQRRNFLVQATLERHGARFVGSGSLVQLLARDKAVITRQSGIGFDTEILSRRMIENGLAAARLAGLRAPSVIVKPNDMTSSIGIEADCVVAPKDAVVRAERMIREQPLVEDVLVQPYLERAREFTVSVLGNLPKPYVSVLELRRRGPREGHLPFTRAEKSIPAADREIGFVTSDDAQVREALTFHSLRLFDWFNLKDYGRFDFIYADRPYLIDVNAMPVLGASFGSELADRFGVDLDDVILLVLTAAAARYSASGRPTFLPKGVTNGMPSELLIELSVASPLDSVPESTIPSAFQPSTHKFTMVDRVGAETDVLYFLKALVHLVKPNLVLETGTYRGATAGAVGAALQMLGGGRLVTLECDPDLAASSRANLAGLPVDVVATSSLSYTPDRPIDLLFLDSTRPARIHEFRRFKRFLSDEALIVWHDSAPEHAVVNRDIQTLVAEGELNAVLLPSPRGLTVSKVRKPGRL
jgi:D-alanine-D-alanine ligase-like ATP-grasp enzyme/predicted O-methyltransferase YrrM